MEEIEDHTEAIRRIASLVATRTRFVLLGRPGVGKTMFARRVPSLLGPMSELEKTWTRAEFIGAGLTPMVGGSILRPSLLPWYGKDYIVKRPFRAPHHTASAGALCGGSARRHVITCRISGEFPFAGKATCSCDRPEVKLPGEMHLARHGVFFLDELTEWSRSTLISAHEKLCRMGASAPYVIASSNACACGRRSELVTDGAPEINHNACGCSSRMLYAYKDRLTSYLRTLGITTIVKIPLVVHKDAARTAAQ